MLKRGPTLHDNTIMGAIEDIFADLDADVSEEEFREAVEAKVEQMGGLADEETAAMLIAHELADEEVNGIADIEPGMEEVKFMGKITSIGEVRTFERDDDDEEGRVVNLDVADETGTIRITFWDEQAEGAAEELEVGTILRIKGRPKEGYNGVEVSVFHAEPDEDAQIDVNIQDSYRIGDLTLGLSDVTLRGKVLDTDSIRTFGRDDGSEGRVANLTLGDETGRLRMTLWDERADEVEEIEPGSSIEVIDGYVRERDGNLELHAGNRTVIETLDEEIEYVPDSADIGALGVDDIDEIVDLAGVVRSADPVRTFDRDDGSEGKVRNIRVQDQTGDVRVALWGDKADKEIAPGDEVQLADIEIRDGWQDDIEGSAGWRSTITVVERSAPVEAGDDAGPGLDAFADGEKPDTSAEGSGETGGDPADGEHVEFTGTVVQAGNPVVLDDGEETVSVETSEKVHLGQEVTARGELRNGRLDAEEVF